MKTCVCDPQRTITDKNVVIPPFVTAGPILRKLFLALSSFDPIRKGKSFHAMTEDLALKYVSWKFQMTTFIY